MPSIVKKRLETFSWHKLAVKKLGGKEEKLPHLGFEPAHADWHSSGDTDFNHQTIWTVVV